MTHVKNGNWVPICKAAVKTLPINRAFSEVEALFSLSCDYDNDKSVSESGLAKRWSWSRKKVRLFLERIGVDILYQTDKKRSPLGGQVGLQARDKLGTSLEQARFIDFNNLEQQRDKLGTRKGQARDKLGDTTIDPNPKPTPKPKEKSKKKTNTYCPNFLLFWDAFGDKQGKAPSYEKSWCKISDLTEELVEKIIEGAKRYAIERQNILAKGGTPKMAQGWLTDRRWEDEIIPRLPKPQTEAEKKAQLFQAYLQDEAQQNEEPRSGPNEVIDIENGAETANSAIGALPGERADG